MTTVVTRERPMTERSISSEIPDRTTGAYLDFVVSFREHNSKVVRPALTETYKRQVDAFKHREGRDPAGLADAKAMLDGQDVSRWWRRFNRTGQEMNWDGSWDAATKRSDEILGSMRASEERSPSQLVHDPQFVYPRYYDEVDFHIQPGSFHRDELSGYVYYFGVQVFHAGTAADPRVRRPMMVNASPVPKDGRVERVLDLASSVGFCAEAWKRRYPAAEVWASDISGPMVRYGHARTTEAGIDVNWKQLAAEAITFPDNHFDVVFVNILFHEVPTEVTRAALREVLRVLRPGGIFVCWDFAQARDWTPWDHWIRDFDSNDNGEPYAYDFCYFDLPAAMRDAGFADVVSERQDAIIALSTAHKPA